MLMFMIRNIPLFIFLMCSPLLFSQKDMSKADVLFFQYEYDDAIAEYKREMAKKNLTHQQHLNLADAYFKTDNYKGASDTYFEVFKKDSTMSSYHFNNMLQAMTRTSGLERTKALLATRSSQFSSELLENADFNFDLLASNDSVPSGFEIFNVSGNSPQADFSPSFYNDRILFTSSRGDGSKSIYGPSGESYFQIFVARADTDGNLLNANLFSGVPSSPYHQATPYYSKDLQQIFYVSSNQEEGELIFDDKGKNSLAIQICRENDDARFVLKNLSTSFYYPFYDSDSDRLYFAAEIEGGYGGTDIYYALTNNGTIMSAPINLGSRINSPGNEIAPFIHEGSLFFASDVFYGLGGMDIYKSEIQTEDSFSIPVNLGKDINSASDDFGLIIKSDGADGLVGYFASNRPGGKGSDDIYGFNADKAPGLKTVIMAGQILNEASGAGIAKARVRLLDMDGRTLKEVYSEEDGAYRVEVPFTYPLRLEIDKARHSSYEADYDDVALDSLQLSQFDINLTFIEDVVEEKEDQTVIKLEEFYFTRGSSKLNEEITTELDKVVDLVAKFPQLQLRIEAHTDSRGGSSTNFRISQNRANAIRDYLLEKGVSDSNILYTIGYGEDKIINQCTNGVYCLDFLHKQNERHLIVILNYDLLN